MKGLGVDIRDQAGLLELRDQGGNRRARETGGACDLGLADLALHAEHLDHPIAVAIPQPGKGPVSILGCRHACDMMVVPGPLSRARTNCRIDEYDNLTNSWA